MAAVLKGVTCLYGVAGTVTNLYVQSYTLTKAYELNDKVQDETGKTVTATGITLSGTDAANYTPNTSTTTTANITLRTLTVTITASNKTYDGTTAASVTYSSDKVSGDTVTISGTAVFNDGVLLPHMELSHATFRKGETFDIQLGNFARKQVGNERWIRRVLRALESFSAFLYYDQVHIGGGNAKYLSEVQLPANARVVANTAGLIGGVRLWELN